MENKKMDSQEIKDTVREKYGLIAKQAGSCCGGGSGCCGPLPTENLSKTIGYGDEEMTSLPEGANLGLSCGNPSAFASLKKGEVVLDLGSGAGMDVFIAAPKVGSTGRVIGVDMTPDMISKARHNASTFSKNTGLNNIEFRLGEIEHLPVADNSVDVVISNCVINLSPDKHQVWREIFRVMKPGGRVSVSDLALLEPLPDEARESVVLLIGCIAGAVLVEETEKMVKDAGLTEVETIKTAYPVDMYADSDDPEIKRIRNLFPPDKKASDYVTSLLIKAKKPL